MSGGIGRSLFECLGADIDRNRARLRQMTQKRYGDTPAAGSKIEENRRLMRLQGLDAGIHQKFCFGPWYQGGGIEREFKPVKFLFAENARNRFASQPARNRSVQLRPGLARQELVFRKAQSKAVAAKNMLGEKLGIAGRIIDAAGTEPIPRLAPCGADGCRLAQASSSMAASWVA